MMTVQFIFMLIVIILASTKQVTSDAHGTSISRGFDTIANISIGRYPFANPFPRAIIPVLLNQIPIALPVLDGWTFEQCIRGMLYSSGLGCTRDLRDASEEFIIELYRELMEGGANETDTETFTKLQHHDTVSIPVQLAGNLYTLIGQFNGEEPDLGPMFNESQDIERVVKAQIVMRKNFLAQQHAVFATVQEDNSASQLWGDTYNNNDTDDRGLVRHSTALIPTMTQLVLQQALKRDFFPTFVINLWHNTVRREFMANQLTIAGLSPAYLMPGVDPVFMSQTTMKELLARNASIFQGHFTVAIAHAQTWLEILDHDLPYAIILEDDVEIHPRVKRVLRKVIPTLPVGWSVLYLDYSLQEMYWPPTQTDNAIPELCTAVLRDSHRSCSSSSGSNDSNINDVHADRCNNDTDHSNYEVVKLDTGICTTASSRAYLLSHLGAKILHRRAIPIQVAPDVLMRQLALDGVIDAYAMMSAGLVTAKRTLGNKQLSQINHRMLKFDDDSQTVVLTYKEGDDINCERELCPITVW